MNATARSNRNVALRVALLATIAVAMLIGAGAPAAAHTDFESSVPADGASVDTPVDEIVITFTTSATPAGDEFQVLDAAGLVRTPTSVTVEDDRIFRLAFDPPLAGGTVGVRWSVRAGDAHPISGSFSFTVTAPLPTTTAPPTTAAPPTTVVPTTTPADSGAGQDEAEATAPTTAPASPTTLTSELPVAVESSAPGATVPTATLDDFLVVDEEPDGAGIARVGRFIGFVGVVLGLGALAVAAAVLIGTRHEVSVVLRAVRVLGAVVAIGAAIEHLGVARLLDESVAGAWSSQAGLATALRFLGGLALAIGVRSTIATRRRPAALSADVAALEVDETRHADAISSERARWRPDGRSWPAAVGVVALLASFWFDGHTVTKGFRPLHALVNTIHVGAAAVWAGGVATLATIAWMRSRTDRPNRFGELIVRFSTVATVSLVAVAIAGSVMTFMITDSIGDLTDTDWGRLLLLKLAAVAIAVAFGAYHHFRLRPALDADPDDPQLLVAVRNTLTAESIVLAFVVIVTVWLVTAAS